MTDNQKDILFDKFEIIECFKKDEYTGVYLARHIYLNKKIILKSLNTKTVPDNTIIERFKREAKILAHLDHPNIIKVLDFGTFNKYFYISFEYFQGSSLREVIKENKISSDKKKDIIVNILQGLTEAHNNGIIHRDIKPENIFVDNDLRVKIGDFGLALSSAESFVTSKAAIVGTPCYMSPEQIGGSKLLPQSDLFSYGVVVYELYTGRNPFLGHDVSESINNIISKDYNELLLELDKLPEDVRSILKKLLIKKVSDRFKSSIEVLRELGVEVLTPANYSTVSLPRIKDNNAKRIITYTASVVIILILGYFFLVKSSTSTDIVLPENDNNRKLIGPDTISISDLPETNTDREHLVELSNNEKTPGERNRNEIVVSENQDEKENNITESENAPIENEFYLQPATKKYGFINIECIPWADIFIDSTKYDTTPIKQPIYLEEGEYELVLSNPDFPKYYGKINILPDETISVKVRLDTLLGYLDCKVYPWGELFIDNESVGKTPFSSPLQLIPGKHTLQILNPAFSEIRDTVVILRNDTLMLHHSFTK